MHLPDMRNAYGRGVPTGFSSVDSVDLKASIFPVTDQGRRTAKSSSSPNSHINNRRVWYPRSLQSPLFDTQTPNNSSCSSLAPSGVVSGAKNSVEESTSRKAYTFLHVSLYS